MVTRGARCSRLHRDKEEVMETRVTPLLQPFCLQSVFSLLKESTVISFLGDKKKFNNIEATVQLGCFREDGEIFF